MTGKEETRLRKLEKVHMMMTNTNQWEELDYIDPVTFLLIALSCILVLFCTKSMKAFGRSFLMVMGSKDYESSQYQESLQSLKMVIYTAAVWGALCFIIGNINCFRLMQISSFDDISVLLKSITVAMLSLFYPLFVCIILMPLYFGLKKHILENGRTGSK